MTITQQKADARKLAFSQRKTAFNTDLDATANQHLQDVLATLPQAKIFAAYMPIRTELSPLPTMNWLADQGKTVCVPVIQGKGQPLKFSVWTPESEMEDGPFGAKVPSVENYVAPDVLVTPLVAFDAEGYRLGYGGGFYDRSIEELAAIKPITCLGFAYSAQNLPSVPREATDQRLSYMVTELGCQRF